jgi:hypothetical protein
MMIGCFCAFVALFTAVCCYLWHRWKISVYKSTIRQYQAEIRKVEKDLEYFENWQKENGHAARVGRDFCSGIYMPCGFIRKYESTIVGDEIHLCAVYNNGMELCIKKYRNPNDLWKVEQLLKMLGDEE